MPASLARTTNAWWALARPAPPPQRRTGADAAWHAALGSIARRTRTATHYLRRAHRLLPAIAEADALDAPALRAAIADAREHARRHPSRAHDRAMATVACLAHRTIGLAPHPNQIACALALLDGAIAELPTGEGKTLAIAMAACPLAWRGRGCHILTANDYLAARDAHDMRPLLEAAGLSIGLVAPDTARDARAAAYAADITYSTAREVAADHLRDGLLADAPETLAGALAAADATPSHDASDHRLLRGLPAAIIDEADALLIDEAATPLILAGSAPYDTAVHPHDLERADALARALRQGRDYRITLTPPSVHLTARGRTVIHDDRPHTTTESAWASPRRREELVELALHAHTILHKDEHYAVIDQRVCIIDTHTGRLLPDRSWRAGLHQAVEAKEGLKPTPIRHTLARIPFQRFFSGYAHLCGTTGTAREVSRELWQTYRLPVVILPPHTPCIRTDLPPRTLATTDAMLAHATAEIARAHAKQRPVLVGTRSVEMSARMADALTRAGLPHEVLNAVRHDHEARIIAAAGNPGAITIATNMAGRGTDIRLGPGVAQLGGLLVLCVETQPSARLERQLLGRAARQGDPGHGIVLRSLDDSVIRRSAFGVASGPFPWLPNHCISALAQLDAERTDRAQRDRIARDEDRIREALEFAGTER